MKMLLLKVINSLLIRPLSHNLKCRYLIPVNCQTRDYGDIPELFNAQAKKKLFTPYCEPEEPIPNTKVSLIGVGKVGQGVLAALVFQRITDNIALYDVNKDKVKGYVRDFTFTALYTHILTLEGSDDLSIIANSKVIVVTAGARRLPNETRIQLVEKNVQVFKKLIPELVKQAPGAVIIIVANPVDVLTYLSVQLAGLPQGQVFGSGGSLDTARQRFVIAKKYNVATTSCAGSVIGEHGQTGVTAYSTITVGGAFIIDVNPRMGESDDKENWQSMRKTMISGGGDVISHKEYTNWAIGLSVANLVDAVLSNSKTVNEVSVLAKGFCGIQKDVYLSLPAIIGAKGVLEIVNVKLSSAEEKMLHESADFLYSVQESVKL